ncbi:MAG: hypothetical protein CMF38_03075 [Legionellaceae bacterium]|nr:hypothetical protein [Legionellaceae bacterium]HCA90274.1 hypothetical protein [Legionellales bacterium]|tara:strand:- start:2169 stop:3089 length:921 start_codon:yes stop_codon:yes gene_type:complete
MLGKIQTFFHAHLHAIYQSLNTLYVKPITCLATIMVITMMLMMPVWLTILAKNSRLLMHEWQHHHQIDVYLVPSISPTQAQNVLVQIQALAGVESAHIMNQSAMLLELKQQANLPVLLDDLPDNLLPDVIEVMPTKLFQQPLKLAQLADKLKSLTLVDEISLDLNWLAHLQAGITFLTKIMYGFSVILALAVMFVIANTLGAVINTQRQEIQILKLIGATHAFITRPYVYMGMWYGIISASLTIALNHLLLFKLRIMVNKLPQTSSVLLLNLSVQQAYELVLIALLLGGISARMAVWWQLKTIEPH